MTRTLALGRLVWRPATIFALGPLSFALLWPAFVLEKQFDNGLRAGLANGTPAVLWIESICFLGLLGALLASAGGAALQPLFSFTVPSLRSSVLRNKLIVGLLLASGLAIGLAYTGDIRGAPGIFSCALFFFSLPSVITDAAERDTLRWGAVALIVAASIQPFKVQALFQTAPAIATVVSFALAVMLLRRESSVGSARRRAIYVPTPVGYALGNSFRRAYASNSDSYSPSSHGPSRTIGTFAWIKAADYEVFGL